MASSIKLFQVFQKCHQTFGIHPRQPKPKQKQLSSNSIQTIFLVCLAQFIFTTAAFLLFKAKSLFDYGFSFYSLITITTSTAIYLILIWQSKNTFEFIENSETFIGKRPQSKTAYKVSIEKIELFNKFFCFGMFMTDAFFITDAPYSFVRYYIFDMGEDSFYLLFPAWFPFDWKTPFGYLVAWLAQCAGIIAVCSMGCQFINLMIGSCWLFIFIAEDITRDAIAFNNAAKATSNRNRTELMKQFCDMVKIYSEANQCVTKFNQIFKYSLFAYFLNDLLGVSSILATVQFELWTDEPHSFKIALLILCLIWAILFIFILCEPGARVTNQFEEFSNEFNRCDWHLLPMELQRCYIIFVSDTQNPIKVLSYANIVCERETSKKLINKAFSYFMTLRNFKP